MSRILLAFSILFIGLSCVHAQEIDAIFGKNRVQYTDDFNTWYRYETENFITYWYGKSRNVAISSIQLAEFDFDEIQDILEHRINEKIELIVYNDIGELYQTNIGLESENPTNAESVQLVGTKLFVQFDGNHRKLREDIREGIAKAYIHSMLYGTSIQEYVQNSFMTDMPEWFKTGIISYAKNPWTEEDDADLRYHILDKKRPVKNFRRLSKRQPDLAGKAFWYYIGKTYGHSSISNIIYLTRINRNINSAFLYILGDEYEDIVKQCFEYHKNRYQESDFSASIASHKTAEVKNTNEANYLNMKLSPNGRYLAYAQNKNGRIIMYYRDLETGKNKRLRRYGYNNPYRETDKNYPVYFWSADSKQLGYIYESRNILEIRILDMETGEIIKNTLNPIFNRIYSADFIDDKTLLINGNTEGFSDLYTYDLVARQQEGLTNDFYDDLNASIATINNVKGILFSSNRQDNVVFPREIDTTLAVEHFDIFFMPLADNSKVFRMSKTPYASEMKAEYSNGKLSYITDQYGIHTLKEHAVSPDFFLSEDSRSIQLKSNIIDKSCGNDFCMYSTFYNRRNMLVRDTMNSTKAQFTSFKLNELNALATGPLLNAGMGEIDINSLDNVPEGWFFDTRFDDTPKEKESVAESAEVNKGISNKVHDFDANRIVASRLRFKLLGVNSYLDNEPLFGGLNSYAGDQVGYLQPPMGLLMKAKVQDSFEDYLFEGGVRLATNFSGYEAFLTFEDRKNQWDHFYGTYFRRRSNRRIDQFDLLERNRENTYILYYQIRYPFDEFQSLRLSSTLRSDRNFTLITNESTFGSPQQNTQRVGLRAEYVYDNSSVRSVNIINGIRAKVFAEGMNRFRVQFANPFTVEPSNGVLGLVGTDIRYYLPVLKKSVLAARISAGTSFGDEPILYYVGGVEGAIGAGFDQSTGIPDRSYSFENIAPQLRGFDRNIRNGTSYVVTTVELRIPIFRHLISDDLRYDFLREFQIVGFFDSGTAWHGASPYSPENPINSASFQSGESVFLDVQYYRDPLIVGYGVGARTSIFGYFLKLDYAAGIETKARLQPRWHFSLGTDF